MNRLKLNLGALLVMVIGGGSVLAVVVWMNQFTQPPAKEARKPARVLAMAPPKPKPKKRRKAQKKRRPKKTSARPRTPPPRLASSLSSISLGAPSASTTIDSGDGSQLLGTDTAQNLVMTSETVDEPPQALRRMPARYPSKARKQGLTGHVSFSLTIGPDGQIKRSRVIASEPAGVFDEAAENAIRRWTFRPGRYKGKPQTVVVEQTIRFTLTRGG